ncbi:MAG: hypothetical protein WD492_00945 [Alkalispirochaeta sp.]
MIRTLFMTRTLIAACGGPIVSRLRKTFPAVAAETESPAMRRRGRMLTHGELVIAELPPLDSAAPASGLQHEEPPAGEHADTEANSLVRSADSTADIVAELAFYLGALPFCSAVLLAVPAPHLIVADRLMASGRRELIPDLLEPTSRFDEAVRVEPIAHPSVWHAADWALRRLGPHQVWVVGLPVDTRTVGDLGQDSTATPITEGAIHRGLRSIVKALEQQIG